MGKLLSRGQTLSALILGAIELFCGILVIILAVVSSNKANLPGAFSPWWAGVVFAIPGVLGVIVGMTKNYGVMIAFMVINIIAFVIQGVGAVLLFIAMAIFVSYAATIDKYCKYNNISRQCVCTPDSGSAFVIDGISSCGELSSIASMAIAICVFLIIAGCISLAASIVGCCSTCCNKNSD